MLQKKTSIYYEKSWWRYWMAITSLLIVSLSPTLALAIEIGDTSPQFELKRIDGAVIKTSEIKDNKSMMLVFWATWCPSCKKEVPKLNQIYKDYKSKDIEILAVNVGVNDSLGRTKRFVKKYRIDYPVAFDNSSRISKLFGIKGVPAIIITDRQGIVRYQSHSLPSDFKLPFTD